MFILHLNILGEVSDSELIEIKEKYKIKDKFILYIGSIFNRRHLPEIIEAFKKYLIN